MSDVHVETKRGPGRPAKPPVVEVPEATEVVTVPKKYPAAAESRFQSSSEYASPVTSYVPETGTPFEEVLKPEYWASIKSLKSRVRIWVEAEDGAYVAMLYVLKTGQGYAKVHCLEHYEMPGMTADPKVPEGYEIQFRGHIIKHRVVRLKDGQVLKQNFDTVEDAMKYIQEYKRMLSS